MPHRPTPESDLRLSGQRFSVEYHIRGSAVEACERADLLCIDQTVEAADHVIPPGVIREHLLGHVSELEPLSPDLQSSVSPLNSSTDPSVPFFT